MTSYDFDWTPRTRLVCGWGSLERLGTIARELGGRRVLVVTDAGLVAAGHVARAEAILARAGLAVVRFAGVHENPTTDDVEACVLRAREAAIDLIVGLGGGSSLDTAKGCNFLLTGGGRMHDYQGYGKARAPMLPMIAVPTTAGTGSECQSYALIADAATHQKMACGDPGAAPRVALLDPELTLGIGVAAVPEAVYQNTQRAHAYALRQGVVVISYSMAVPYLLTLLQLAIRFVPRSELDPARLSPLFQALENALADMEKELNGRLSQGLTMVTNSRGALQQHVGTALETLARLQGVTMLEEPEQPAALPAQPPALEGPAESS